MSFDLKPLSNEVIHKMNYAPHDLWIVKIADELFGPFEVESLKHYAMENETELDEAQASRMDTNNWQPFFSHAHFQPVLDHAHSGPHTIEKFWLIHLGQKAGPVTRRDIEKKIELGILTVADVISVDDGHSWHKLFTMDSFGALNSEVGPPPMAPLESSFAKAKEELNEWMDNQDRSGQQADLAALTYLGQHKENVSLKLEEMDLKSLAETEVSRSLKWAIPAAVAGVGLFVMMGSFMFSETSEMASVSEEKSEVILPNNNTHTTMRENNPGQQRSPSSYQPIQRSALTAQPAYQNEYPTHVETHYNEPDPMIDPSSEAENQPEQENSLVSNNVPGNETLDQAMGGESNDAPPEQPVIEEASDF
jgi:hypothetical protein